MFPTRSLSVANLLRVSRSFSSGPPKGTGFFDKASRDWEKAWQMNLTPWDVKGTVTPSLRQLVVSGGQVTIKGGRTLVPGCGSGYDCAFLAQSGAEKVIGLDISKTAIDKAKENTDSMKLNNLHFEIADFFTYQDQKPFDFIFDYLFMAALDPPMRAAWATSMTRLLCPKRGVLMTLLFPLRRANDNPLEGPPYPVLLDDYHAVLDKAHWELVEINENPASIKPRQGRELVALWRLKK